LGKENERINPGRKEGRKEGLLKGRREGSERLFPPNSRLQMIPRHGNVNIGTPREKDGLGEEDERINARLAAPPDGRKERRQKGGENGKKEEGRQDREDPTNEGR
jgi:hypothetical protein